MRGMFRLSYLLIRYNTAITAGLGGGQGRVAPGCEDHPSPTSKSQLLQRFSGETAVGGRVAEGNRPEHRDVIMDLVDWNTPPSLHINTSSKSAHTSAMMFTKCDDDMNVKQQFSSYLLLDEAPFQLIQRLRWCVVCC